MCVGLSLITDVKLTMWCPPNGVTGHTLHARYMYVYTYHISFIWCAFTAYTFLLLMHFTECILYDRIFLDKSTRGTVEYLLVRYTKFTRTMLSSKMLHEEKPE